MGIQQIVKTMAVGAFLCVVVAGSIAADWPNWRGPNWDGKSPETGINKDWKTKPPKELWRIKMSDDGFSGLCVAGGKLFVIDHDVPGKQDIVRAIDVKTGNELWRYGFRSVEAPGHGYCNTTPAFEGGRLYVVSALKQIHCLDAKKGTMIWMRDLKADFQTDIGGAASPVIDGNNVTISAGGPNLMLAFNKETGANVWQGGGEGGGGASHCTMLAGTFNGKRQCVGITHGKLVSVDANNGRTLWEVPTLAEHIPSPIVAGDNIFIGATGLHSFERRCTLVTPEGNILWEKENGAGTQDYKQSQNPEAIKVEKQIICPYLGTPIYADGYIYGSIGELSPNRAGPKQPQTLLCVEAKTGAVAWQGPDTGFQHFVAIAVDGVLIAIRHQNGPDEVVMVKLNPKAYEELGRFKLEFGPLTAPAIADGKLFLRNGIKFVTCFDLK